MANKNDDGSRLIRFDDTEDPYDDSELNACVYNCPDVNQDNPCRKYTCYSYDEDLPRPDREKVLYRKLRSEGKSVVEAVNIVKNCVSIKAGD